MIRGKSLLTVDAESPDCTGGSRSLTGKDEYAVLLKNHDDWTEVQHTIKIFVGWKKRFLSSLCAKCLCSKILKKYHCSSCYVPLDTIVYFCVFGYSGRMAA